MKIFEVGAKVVYLDKKFPEHYGWICEVVRHQTMSQGHYHVVKAIDGKTFKGQSGNIWGAENGTLEDADIYNSPLYKALK